MPLMTDAEISVLCKGATGRRPRLEVMKPAGTEWSIAMSAGSMSALDHAIGMFLNPGESWPEEDPIDASLRLTLVPVPCDDDGIVPSKLAALLKGAKVLQLGQERPGIVFRLDTVSKLLSPGFRLGWAFEDLCYVSSQSGCSMSMICLGKLLAHWQTEGLEAQVQRLQLALRLRCRSLLRACEVHLQDLALWSRPQAGMFLWLRMRRPKKFTHQELLESLQRNKVAPMPGGFCSPARTGEPVPCFRLSYVTPLDSYDLALQRLRKALVMGPTIGASN
eukprot:Skav208093  [mRNA]  locus=scaffold1681:103723:118609:- [translate_table: standard]